MHCISVTGLSPSTAGHSKPFTYACTIPPTSPAELERQVPQPRPCNARRLSHMARFSLIRVRSPLLTESLLFSLPVGTEMFHFPTFPPHTLYIQVRVTTSPCNGWRGFPIRTPSDQSSVINSPRLIADSYVLLRLLMPRHPPCALKNLTTHKQPTHRQQHTKRRTRKISYFIYRENHGKLKELPRFIHVSKKLLPYKRCSRSLCSSQTTTPPHTNPPKAPNNPSHKEEPPDTAWQAAMRRKPGNKPTR